MRRVRLLVLVVVALALAGVAPAAHAQTPAPIPSLDDILHADRTAGPGCNATAVAMPHEGSPPDHDRTWDDAHQACMRLSVGTLRMAVECRGATDGVTQIDFCAFWSQTDQGGRAVDQIKLGCEAFTLVTASGAFSPRPDLTDTATADYKNPSSTNYSPSLADAHACTQSPLVANDAPIMVGFGVNPTDGPIALVVNIDDAHQVAFINPTPPKHVS